MKNYLARLMIAILAVGVIAHGAAAQHDVRLATCPPVGDTLSLLQPTDSAFADARAVAATLNRAGLTVRCITRSTAVGLAGVGNVAGLQTIRGTVTVFFVPADEHFRLSQRQTRHGYQLTYAKSGTHPARTVLTTDGTDSLVLVAQAGRYYQLMDATLAAEVRRAIAAR